jgi:hypothetical protein
MGLFKKTIAEPIEYDLKEKQKEIEIPSLSQIEESILRQAHNDFIRTVPYITESLWNSGFAHRYVDRGPVGVLVLEQIKEHYEQEGFIVEINGIEYKIYHPKYRIQNGKEK